MGESVVKSIQKHKKYVVLQLQRWTSMNIEQELTEKVKEAVQVLYSVTLPSIEFQPTRKDFEGDITLVIFPMLRHVKGNPVAIGTAIGDYLKTHVKEVSDVNVIKGFLNIVISDDYYLKAFSGIQKDSDFGLQKVKEEEAVLVEYSSPNTNKPLHLGHIRNNLLGYSVAEILKASGK